MPSKETIDRYFELTKFSLYPWNLFSLNELEWINCKDVTIFYGNNGSGKSTLLNLIAEKIQAKRNEEMFKDVFYSNDIGEFIPFDDLLDELEVRMAIDDFGKEFEMPNTARLITSDDIFKKIYDRSTYNKIAVEKIKRARIDRELQREKGLTFRANSDNMEEYQKIRDARRLTKAAYAKIYAPTKQTMKSNGETALDYNIMTLEEGGIYLLDEPENSLSPSFQSQLIDIIEDASKYLKCQFFICTHSPFILSLSDALIYNLDLIPVQTQEWAELENVKIYHDFFSKKENEFKE